MLCSGLGPLFLYVLEFVMIIALAAFLLFGPASVASKIYNRFPESQTFAEGPLRGFKVRTSGAFAAFFIVFLAYLPIWYYGYNLINKGASVINNQCKPGWTVKIRQVEFEDKDQKLDEEAASELIEKLSIVTQPEICFEHKVSPITVRIPEENQSKFPTLYFKIDKSLTGTGYTGATLILPDFNSAPECIKDKKVAQPICIDHDDKTIVIAKHILNAFGNKVLKESGNNPADYKNQDAAFVPAKPQTKGCVVRVTFWPSLTGFGRASTISAGRTCDAIQRSTVAPWSTSSRARQRHMSLHVVVNLRS